MSLLKQPDERAFDDITSATVELTERLEMFAALHDVDDEFSRLMLEHRVGLDTALDALSVRLQDYGYVPSSGNVELAELGAVAAKARAVMTMESETAVMTRRLSKDLDTVEQAINDASDAIDDDHPACADVSRLHSRVHAIRETLRGFRTAQS